MDHSVLSYFTSAGLVVKVVMLLLLLASVVSWTFILQRGSALSQTQSMLTHFEKRFWSGVDLHKLYQELDTRAIAGIEAIFHSGFREYVRLSKQAGANTSEQLLEGVQRAMRIAYAHELDKLEKNLNFLATVGSTSPYVGLFGTVWGIMTVFHALGDAQQPSIALVAPGISEALVATAMGLFAAIPAVIAYNRYSSRVDRLLDRYQTFQEEFSAILFRQLQSKAAPVAGAVTH
jgi:biopolymer transport protein TolQ